MKIVEVKEDIRDTSIVRDIFDIAKISQRINLYSEFITDINYTDFQYIQVLLSKSKTMLSNVNFILENYYNMERNERNGRYL